MDRPPLPPASTRMSMSSSSLSSMLDPVTPLPAKNRTQSNNHAQASGIPSGSHVPLPPSSGGPDTSFAGASNIPVTAASSASNQFTDATAAQTIASLVTTIDASSPPSSKTKEVFEFTKRKRWADLLITELTEAIILVLSQDGTVWYCGNAVHDLLGWRDDELVDKEFTEVMNEDDRAMFQSTFMESIQQKSEMESYARLQCKPTEPFLITTTSGNVGEFTTPPPKEVLFEIKGYPHFLPNTDEFKCFFAVAKPYPSRNTAMLNTFLELKIENERLQERLSRLKLRQGSLTTSSPSTVSTSAPSSSTAPAPPPSYSPHVSQYSHIYSQEPSHGLIPPPSPNGELPTNAGFLGGGYEDLLPGSVNVRFDTSNAYGQSSASVGEEESGNGSSTGAGDPSGPRKKVKKVYTAEQYVCVTCGRTDSPEWRKGPTGPKTLCNACGLRWAKRVRTSKSEEAGKSAS